MERPQCTHLDERGNRCWRPPEEGSALCSWHAGELGLEPPRQGPNLRRLAFRVAALLLLTAFLLPLAIQAYRMVKTLLN